jgi:transcription termination/antitermination protein NusG
MNYYVIQVRTRGEQKYMSLARQELETEPVTILFPQRKLKIRKKGVVKDSLAPIFPGYVFVGTEELTTQQYWLFKRVPGFFRFLEDNDHITPLEGSDRELLLHFLKFGEIVDTSRVVFDENARIRVVEGPLSGLEGNIVRVDRRKGRAKVRLDMYNSVFLVDFGFETLEKLEKKEA